MSDTLALKYEGLQNIFPAVSRETVELLVKYEEAVRKWQPHINLIANATLPQIWTRHILDSAQVYPLYMEASNWCDIGSGGGFPGIVTAIFLKQNGNGHIKLIESNGKKASFLRSVIAELNLPATVYQRRIEDCYREIDNVQVTSSRALASLKKLFELCQPWFEKGTTALFQKGQDYANELEEARVDWLFDFEKFNSKIDEKSVILKFNNVRQRKG